MMNLISQYINKKNKPAEIVVLNDDLMKFFKFIF